MINLARGGGGKEGEEVVAEMPKTLAVSWLKKYAHHCSYELNHHRDNKKRERGKKKVFGEKTF